MSSIIHPTLGTALFYKMDGVPTPSGYQCQDITRPGVAGKSYTITGYFGEPFTVQTSSDFSSAAALGTALVLYKQFQCGIVSLTDSMGNTWLNMFVKNVRPVSHQRVENSVGTGIGVNPQPWVLVCDWELESVETGY